MRGRALSISLLLAAALLPQSAAAQGACPAEPDRAAVSFVAEVAGSHGFERRLASGWTFALVSADKGWDLRLFDGEGRDLTAGTPPLRGPNARELYGWHFRNADNSGPNDGSVNAPQGLRVFAIEPADGAAPGRGSLEMLDYGLADLEPGQQARLVYLLFELCLDWPDARPQEAGETGGFSPALHRRLTACGLPSDLALAPYLEPTSLAGDFDADGLPDVAVPVVRLADGKRAIALCLGDSLLELVGLQGTLGELVPAYFDHIDWWGLVPPGPVGQGAGVGPPPAPEGDSLTIGKEGASSVLLYWDGGGFDAYWQGD